ncbi:hypothetical protein DQT32_04940 [Salmonella enterica subsp. enterica serovar Braenderup]|nr:hypothetical protein [Salmonella enterica subsp. enterica serovar Braenderup]
MAYTVKGDMDVAKNITVQGKTVGVSITTTDNSTVYTADTNGHMTLPVPNSSDIDYIVNQFPVSQYGAINNNPIGVSGTFDGGSTPAYYSSMPVLLENDGTLAILRPGTNGATINYYYTYINTPETSTQPNTTIQKYYTGSSKNIIFYDSYTKDTLIYEDIDNHVIHIVQTNGTLQKASHKEATVPRSSVQGNILSALKAGNYVYIFTLYNPGMDINSPISMSNPYNVAMRFLVYRVPVSEIIAGTISTFQQVTGISGQNMYGVPKSGATAIEIADIWSSTSDDTGVQSFYKYPNGVGIAAITYSITGAAKSYYDGTNIFLSFYTNGYCYNNTGRYDTMFGFTVTFNPSTNVYSTDLSAIPITATGGTTGLISWNNPYSINSNYIYGSGSVNTDGNSSSWYITDNGVQYAVKEKYVLSDFYLVTRCVINNFTTKADAYKIRNRSLNQTSRTQVTGDYASRVGDQLSGGSPISSTRIMFTGTGTYNGVNYGKYYRGISDIGTTRTYTYNSFMNGTLTGYAPQIYRVPFGNTNESLMRSKISLCDAAGNVTSYGCAFMENVQLSAGYQLDPNTLTYGSTLSISNTTLVNLKNSILASAGVSASSSLIGLYYVPDSSYCKSIATIPLINSTGGGRYIFATVDCTVSSGVITSATLNTIFFNGSYPSMQTVANTNEIFCKSGLSCVKYSDFTYIAFSGLVNYSVPGDYNELSCCGIVSENTVSNPIVSNSYHASLPIFATANLREYSYIPNYGFGYYMFANNDSGTKLVFKQCGNTLAQFNANMAAGTGTNTVVLAQDIPVGFYIYFTEVTPLFMGGQYYDIPISVVDLNKVTASPGNKSYYLYIQLILGTPTYVASLTEIPESSVNMFIGTATTDGTKVSALNIKKVSRFDLYRPSLTQIGSAFPVSSGNPQQTGSISW